MPKKFLTVKEVSRLLGVTPLTIRNWDKKGALVAYRHPVNNYRMYKIEDVEKLMKGFKKRSTTETIEEKPQVRKLKIEEL